MADYAANSSIVALQDPGMGTGSHHDPDSAGLLSAPAAAGNGAHVASGLDVTVDATNDEITVGGGVAIVHVDQPDVQSSPDGDYTRTLQGPVPVAVSVQQTTVGADVDAVNDVYLFIDPTTADSAQIRVGSAVSEPANPSVYLGRADTSAGTFEHVARFPQRVEARAMDVAGAVQTPRNYEELVHLSNAREPTQLSERYSSPYDTLAGRREASTRHLQYAGDTIYPDTSDVIGQDDPGLDGCVIDLGFAEILDDVLTISRPASSVTIKNVKVGNAAGEIGPSGASHPIADEIFIENVVGVGDQDLTVNAQNVVIDGTTGVDMILGGDTQNVTITGTDVNTTVTINSGVTDVVVYGQASVTDNDGSNSDQTA